MAKGSGCFLAVLGRGQAVNLVEIGIVGCLARITGSCCNGIDSPFRVLAYEGYGMLYSQLVDVVGGGQAGILLDKLRYPASGQTGAFSVERVAGVVRLQIALRLEYGSFDGLKLGVVLIGKSTIAAMNDFTLGCKLVDSARGNAVTALGTSILYQQHSSDQKNCHGKN